MSKTNEAITSERSDAPTLTGHVSETFDAYVARQKALGVALGKKLFNLNKKVDMEKGHPGNMMKVDDFKHIEFTLDTDQNTPPGFNINSDHKAFRIMVKILPHLDLGAWEKLSVTKRFESDRPNGYVSGVLSPDIAEKIVGTIDDDKKLGKLVKAIVKADEEAEKARFSPRR
jgi:hypothetical protein